MQYDFTLTTHIYYPLSSSLSSYIASFNDGNLSMQYDFTLTNTLPSLLPCPMPLLMMTTS